MWATPLRRAVAITLLGGLLRLYRYNALGLWFDEGGSIYLARLPWDTILFNIQQHDTHPPGHPLVLKFFTLILPEIVAGRLLSVLCGTLTIFVLFELARRLLGVGPALVASLILAISPLHIWYSQEGRQYAGVVLLVALSYLALAAFHTSPRPRWAVLYAVATFFALFYDYSSIYALAPQVAIFAYLAWKQRRRALLIFVAPVIVLVAFFPWGITMVATVNAMTQERAPALGVTPESVAGVFLSIAGVAGYERYFYGDTPTPWEALSAFQWAIVIILMLATVTGIVSLAVRARLSPPAILVGLGLFVGTLLVGVAVSLYRPGFTERTVLSASLGWAILLGAAVAPLPFDRLTPYFRQALRVAGHACVITLMAFSASTLAAIYGGGDKDHWREMAADTTRFAKWGYPLLSYHAILDPIFDVYAPNLLDNGYGNIKQGGDLPSLDSLGALKSDAVWLNYIELDGIERIHAQLEELGYSRLLHVNYSEHSVNRLYMDFYAQVSASRSLAHELPVYDEDRPNRGWGLPSDVTWQDTTSDGGLPTFQIAKSGPAELHATRYIEVEPGPSGLYGLIFEARAKLTSGRLRAFLHCSVPPGEWVNTAPDGVGETIPNDDAWHEVIISVLCPEITSALVVDLRHAGDGEISFRDFKLYAVAPTP